MFDKFPGQRSFTINPLATPDTLSQRPLPFWLRYGLAILLPFAAVGLLLLLPEMRSSGLNLPFLAAVGIVAWFCGVFPASLSTVLSALMVDYFFREPLYMVLVEFTDYFRLATYLLIALLINIP